MRISHSTVAALLGVAMVFGPAVHAQSGGGASGGGSGAATSGGVAGSTGSTGAASGVSGRGSGIGAVPGSGFGAGAGVGGNRGFGAATPVPGAFSQRTNGGFNNNRSAFGPNQSGFDPNQQGFNQNRNQSEFNGGRGDFERSARSFDRQQGFSGQGSFDSGGQAEFSQGIANQGAFGLGNGNRSGFFDNQPFNNQGFGRRTAAGFGTNSSNGFADNDPAGFAGSERNSGQFGEAGDPVFTGSEFQPRSLDSNVDQQGFDGGFDDGTSDGSFRGQRFGDDREDFSSSGDSRESGSDSVLGTGTGIGVDPSASRSSRADDPPGFEGTGSPFSRSASDDTGRADERFGEQRFRDEPTSFDQREFANRQATLRTNDRLNGQADNVGGAGRPAASFGGRNTNFDDGNLGGANSNADRANGSFGQRNGTFDGRGATNNNGPFFSPSNDFQPRGDGFGPGGYQFLEEYSATHQPVQPDSGGRQGAAGVTGTGRSSGRGSGTFQPRQPDSQRPNYFNGSYSRSRL